MKLSLNEQDLNILKGYFSQLDCNIYASQVDSAFLNEHYDEIAKDDLDACLANGMDEKEGMRSLFLSIIGEEDEDISDVISSCDLGSIKCLNENDYRGNPYFQYIKVKNITSGKYSLEQNYYAPYECFVYDQIKEIGNEYGEYTPIGYFKSKFPYVVMTENNLVWMSITPYEINTMKKSIDEAKGKVLTFGLGLGYYAFMASQKDVVESVTIIENSSSVISLFKEHILPQFPNKDKIHIIKGDAFIYMKSANDYDSVFVDIYHSAEDALPLYIRFKEVERKRSVSVPVHYWIEESILAYFRRFVLTFLMENIESDVNEADYLNDSTDEERVMKKIYLALKDKEFTSIEEIQSLLSFDGLKKLISTF